MKIDKIIVTDLWNKYTINWNLNPGINILSGINGSGKSTLLQALSAVLKGDFVPESLAQRLSSMTVVMTNGIEIHWLSIRGEAEVCKRRMDELQVDKILWSHPTHKQTSRKSMGDEICAQGIFVKKNGDYIGTDSVLNKKNCSFISTFDFPAPRPSNPEKMMEYLMKSATSELDRHLDHIVKKYMAYQIELTNRLLEMLKNGTDRLEEVNSVFERRTEFQDIFDRLLAKSGKRINRKKGEFEFIFNTGAESHPYTDLSAGEKQLLLIMLTVFMQGDKESILIMDEPEISLHIDWQNVLLDVINEINPHCQVIVSTHSPSLILHGWQNVVMDISDIASQN